MTDSRTSSETAAGVGSGRSSPAYGSVLRFSELNWPRAMAEVALIFVGITLALLFDNWNTNRKERVLERQLLVEVRDNLIETRSDLETDIRNSERRLGLWRDLMASLVAEASLGPQWATTLGKTLGSSIVVAKTSGYRSLTSQGLGILSDPEVRKAITDFYELRLERIAHFEDRARSYLHDTYRPFVHEITRIPEAQIVGVVDQWDQLQSFDGLEPLDPEHLKVDPRLPQVILQAANHTRMNLFHYRLALDDIDTAMQLINAQLGGSSSSQPVPG